MLFLNQFFRLFLKLRYSIPLIVVFLAILIYLTKPFGILGSKSDLENIQTETVKKEAMSTTISASGTVEAENQATLMFLSPGRITYIPVKEGDPVKKWQILASLDSTEAAQSVSIAKANLKSAQSSLEKVIDDIHLWQYGNGGTKGETQTQKNNREEAEMSRDSAYQSLQKAKKGLEWTVINAPFDGVITEISGMNQGQNITAATNSYIKLVGPSNLKFTANVDEIDYTYLSASQSGEVILDALPEETFAGQILKIGDSAVKLSTGGSVVPVDIRLPSDLRLKNGLNGEVNFTVVSPKEVLSVPKSAVTEEKGESFVFLLKSKTQEKVKVSLGQTFANRVEILSGVNEGDKVILK